MNVEDCKSAMEVYRKEVDAQSKRERANPPDFDNLWDAGEFAICGGSMPPHPGHTRCAHDCGAGVANNEVWAQYLDVPTQADHDPVCMNLAHRKRQEEFLARCRATGQLT